MNKFVGIVLLAIIAGVAAVPVELEPESELSIVPSNEEETAALMGDNSVFSDYCIKRRDYIIGDIKSQSNSMAASVFSLFFKNAAEIGQNALDVERAATEILGNQIRNPDAEISESTDATEAERIIAEGQQKIRDVQTQPRTFLQAVISTIGATGNTVATGVVSKLNKLAGVFGIAKVGEAISNVCSHIAKYEDANKVAFEQFVESIAAKDAVIGKTSFETVPCLTTRRISRLDGICKFSAVSHAPVTQIMNSMQ